MNTIISPLEDSNLQETASSLRTQMFGPNTFISQDDSGYSDRWNKIVQICNSDLISWNNSNILTGATF